MSIYKKKPDIIIKNGKIIDGTGMDAYYADIAIIDDKIDYIGDLSEVEAPVVIDASGKLVTPGFIDSHTHSDWTMWANPEFQSAVRQGVTTEIVGNCGFSMRHDLTNIPFDKKADGIKCVYDMFGEKDIPKGAMAAVLDKAEKMGTSINTAWLCGHNDLRVIAGINNEEYTEEQFKIMEDFLHEAMEAGFIGFSTGLEFDPGIMSKADEVERLALVAAEYDANYSSHMRDEGTYILEAIEEFLSVIRKTGMRGTISHLNVKYDNGIPNDYLQKGMQMLKDARENEHLNVYADMLPTCFSSGGATAILPPWLYSEGWDKAKEILADPEGREKVKNDLDRYWRFLGAGQWDRLINVQAKYMPELLNMPFAEFVKKQGKDPADCFLDIIAAAPSIEEARGVDMQANVFHEQTMIDSVVKDPIYMWMTDARTTEETGPVAALCKNVQYYMSMTYFFSHYVRDAKAISIEKAVNKVTGMPAKHYKLEKRGMLQEGYFADINIFELDNLKINATFAEPCKYSEGMDFVFVNGKAVIENGNHTMERAGRVLRHLAKK